MNWRRGLLRLWLVLSLCWVVVVGLYAWAEHPKDELECGEVVANRATGDTLSRPNHQRYWRSSMATLSLMLL
jgi:hypothetical protein